MEIVQANVSIEYAPLVSHCTVRKHLIGNAYYSIFTRILLTFCVSGKFKGVHSIVCLDGNFEHKRSRSAGKGDQALVEPHSFFIPQDVVLAMETEVENKRRARQYTTIEDAKDAILPGLNLQNHVFDGCSERFYAAKESNQKAESAVFSDTGLMLMACRHDRPIYMVNIQSPGEKQYNPLALIKQLFLELPDHWNVGILYDIGCQLHKSITKV